MSPLRGLAAADVEGRLEGELFRFAEFRDRILEKMSFRVLEVRAEFRLVSRAVILEGVYNRFSERLDEPRGLVDGVVLVGRTGRWLATSRLELLAGALVPRLVVLVGRMGCWLATSRLELLAGALVPRLVVLVGRTGCWLATSRLELLAGALVPRLVVLVGRTGCWLATSRLELLAGALVPRLVVLVGRTSCWLATSRLELLAGALVPRLVAVEGARSSRFEDGDGFRISRFELVDGRRVREEDRGIGPADFEVRVVVTVLGNLGMRNGDVVREVAGDFVRRVAGLADLLRPEVVLEREGCAEPRLDPREGNLTVPRDDGLREVELRGLGLREAELRVEEERFEGERVEEERGDDGAAELRDEPDREDERLTVRFERLERLDDLGEREALLEERPELADEERPEVF